jgi:nicotinamidase-related amidase
MPLKVPPRLAPREDDLYIRKHVYSGFFDSRLDTALRNLSIETLVCAGLWANVCMAATALDALYRNYRVIWLRDGTLAGEGPEEVATLANTARWIAWFEDVVGYTVTSGEFAAACEAAFGP